ncbi:Elongator subunit elp2, partial [Coemansia sp. RSA 2603]
RDSTWAPRAAASGHWAAVRDVCWHPSGLGVLTAGADQTARLFAKTLSEGWREVARPQVHGYGVRAAAFVGHAAYVSAGEEKVARVFGATRRFADAWAALVGQPLPDAAQLVAGASQPVLGLSNKALGDRAVEAPANDTYSVRQAHTDVHAARASAAGDVPLEEQLAGATLWAESDKLYAHAYELHTLATGTTGRWAATACRATDARHANVLVYHVPAHPSAPWPAPQPLDGHALTVTRVRFAQGDTRLLTVGRDRMWNVYERGDEGFRRVAKQARAHARVIWDAAWAPGARVFATASRDRSVRLWHVDPASAAASDVVAAPVVLAFPDAVTAVDFVPHEVNGRWVLAAALECGRVFVLSARAQDEGVPAEWVPQELPPECAHVAAVNRLAWCPHGDANAWLLASVSDDHTLRISRITMHF